MFGDNPQILRDEAMRSGSPAAMAMIIGAQSMGLGTFGMIGFDPAGVSREFGLKDNEVPVMLLSVGYPAEGNWPSKGRRDVSQVLSIV